MNKEMDYENLVIDESNFSEYFFDVNKHAPKKGQIMARYTATAFLEDGNLKRDLIDLLMKPNKGEAVTRVMKVLGGAITRDSYRVPREMAADLLSGMTPDEVAAKPYKYTFENFYWTERGIVPDNDPHWYTIPILNWGKLYDAQLGELDFTEETLAGFLPGKGDEDGLSLTENLV
jgi:hypothetical protein